jgi:hypothetical protein
VERQFDMLNVINELIKFSLLNYRRNNTGSVTKTPVVHKYTNTFLQMMKMIIIIIIDIFLSSGISTTECLINATQHRLKC